MEDVVIWGMMAYDCPNASGDYTVAPRDTYTPGDMRAPGAATGLTLFEIAMDEMAYEAKVDPLEFRLINYSDTDQMHGTQYTSKALREAYAQGAEAFGWSRRSFEPRSMRDGKELVGWGVATGMWDAMFSKTSARATLSANGHLEVATAASDIGTGTYTVMTLVAADMLGLPPEQITPKLGDSTLPTAPVEGGSWMAASVGAAVQVACQTVAEKLLAAAARVDGKPLGNAKFDDVLFEGGRLILKSDPGKSVSIADAMRAADLQTIEAEETASMGLSGMISQVRKSRNTHSAIFAEVKVDEELGVIRVTRIVNAVAAGRIISAKTARSQILGGVVMGVGMALHEETFADHRIGRFMNHNLAEYHVPVNADIEDIEVIFVDEHDPEVTPLGVKGVGEIGIVGTAAAIANAIYHATGKRVRSLPVTIDKLLD
jgi:xanthine dehydrogenase YagR molybdenum-binding subunit